MHTPEFVQTLVDKINYEKVNFLNCIYTCNGPILIYYFYMLLFMFVFRLEMNYI